MAEDEVVEAEVLEGRELGEAMDESIRATLKDIQSRNAEAPIDKIDDAVIAESETVAKANEKPRDQTGKFTKAEKAKESAAPEKADTQTPIAASASDQAAAGAAEDPVATPQGIDLNRAPSSWKPAAKAVWATLPEPVRAEIYRREGDFHNGNKGIKENADFGQSIKQIVEPYRHLIQAEGGTPEKAISNYFQAASVLKTGTAEQKLQTIFGLDKQFDTGLNAHFQRAVAAEVARITGQPGQQVQPNYKDPRVDQLVAKLEQQERERTAEAERVSNSASGRFISSKDEKGQPLYPFVDNVIDDMSARVGMLRRSNPAMGHDEILKQAYDAAVWANPETRAVLIGQQQAAASQSTEKLQKVEQAKRASAVNVPKRGAIPATQSVASLKFGTPESDESIRETLRQLQANN